jgi:ATP-dependent DNA helicase PIF1
MGMPLIVIRNMDVDNGLCNGTKVYVTRLLRHSIGVKVFNCQNDHEFILPRINFVSDDDEYPFVMLRRQLPVRPAFAMTIHKSQGQTLSNVVIYLNTSVFTHGQLYVAFSRATHPRNLYVAVPINQQKQVQTATNIVYNEVLL